MNLAWLNTFKVVVECGSYSKAADLLYMTQPAVSQHVRHLEASFGAPLRDSASRGIVLTPGGQAVYELAVRMLQDVRSVREILETATAQPDAKAVTIGSGPTLQVGYVPTLARRIWELHPEIHINTVTIVSPTEIRRSLQEGRIDVALQTSPFFAPSDPSTPCIDERFVAVCTPSHPLVPHATARGVATARVALLPRVTESRRLVEGWIASVNLAFTDVFERNTLLEVLGAAVAGLAVGFVPSWLAADDLRNGRLVELDLEGLDLRRTVFAVYGVEPTSSARVLIKAIKSIRKDRAGQQDECWSERVGCNPQPPSHL